MLLGLLDWNGTLRKWKWESLSRVRLFETPWTLQPMEFSRPEYWSEEPSPGGLPNPGIKPRSPALRVDSLHLSHQESPRILEWVAYFFSRGSSLPRNQTGVSGIAGRFLLSYEGSPEVLSEVLSEVTVKSRHSEKAMAPHSSTLAWETPWMEEPGRLQSMGPLRVGHNWATSL